MAGAHGRGQAGDDLLDVRLVFGGVAIALVVVLMGGFTLLASRPDRTHYAAAISEIEPGDEASISTHDLDDDGAPDVAVINGQTVDIPKPSPREDWLDRWGPLAGPVASALIVAVGAIVVALLNRAERGRLAELDAQVADQAHWLAEIEAQVADHADWLAAGEPAGE